MSSTHFGEHLRREREMRGVSLEEISLATRIAPRFLTALENEQWEKLPGGVFNRGFIRSIAHYLGLDEDSMVAEYALHTKGRAEPGVVADPPNEPESHWRQITVLVVFAVVVVAVVWFAILYLVPRVTAYMHKRSVTVSGENTPGLSQAQVPLDPASANPDPSRVLAASVAPADTSGRSESPSLTLKLEATLAADVTILADGKTTFSGHMNVGDVKEFSALDSIQVSASAASALLLDLNGQMVLLPGQPDQPSSITLTHKDLTSSGASH